MGGKITLSGRRRSAGATLLSPRGMRIEISTPALLFPAVSLLMLAYTNRFFGLAAIIRNLHRTHTEKPNPVYLLEIKSMRSRMRLIRDMQSFGMVALILCMICMLLIFGGHDAAGKLAFGASLVCMLLSLVWALIEIRLSGRALDLHLQDLEQEETSKETGAGSDGGQPPF
jgi:hypothetical protein